MHYDQYGQQDDLDEIASSRERLYGATNDYIIQRLAQDAVPETSDTMQPAAQATTVQADGYAASQGVSADGFDSPAASTQPIGQASMQAGVQPAAQATSGAATYTTPQNVSGSAQPAGQSYFRGASAYTQGDGGFQPQSTRAASSASYSTPSSGSYSYAQPSPAASNRSAGSAKKSGGGLKTFFTAFAGALLACIVAFGALTGVSAATNGAVSSPITSVTLGSGESTIINAAEKGESLAEAVADKALPSIVAIDVYTSSMSYGSWFGQSGDTNTLIESSLGSGVVISADGYILTNYHVIEGAEKLMATVGGEELEATVVGTDPSSDLAVIKVDPEGQLTPIEIGSSADLKPGQWVMTLGSPFGLEQSVATGIVSATSRTVAIQDSYSMYGQGEVSLYVNMIQTDAAINPGNSGGALVDENARLIGINSVIESYSGSYSGVGFAIPVDYAINIAQQIIEGKTPTHAQLGVATTTITAEIAQRNGLSVSAGAYISRVYNGTGAAEAGLEVGDIITRVDNTTVSDATDLTAAVRSHNVGDTVSITYINGDGEEQVVEVTLGSDQDSETFFSDNEGQSREWGNGWGNTWRDWLYGNGE